MSLRDLVKPPKPPSRRGRVVSLASTEEDGARWSDAARARAAARMKALNADPEFKARMKALHADPEFKERRIAAVRASFAKRRAAK